MKTDSFISFENVHLILVEIFQRYIEAFNTYSNEIHYLLMKLMDILTNYGITSAYFSYECFLKFYTLVYKILEIITSKDTKQMNMTELCIIQKCIFFNNKMRKRYFKTLSIHDKFDNLQNTKDLMKLINIQNILEYISNRNIQLDTTSKIIDFDYYETLKQIIIILHHLYKNENKIPKLINNELSYIIEIYNLIQNSFKIIKPEIFTFHKDNYSTSQYIHILHIISPLTTCCFQFLKFIQFGLFKEDSEMSEIVNSINKQNILNLSFTLISNLSYNDEYLLYQSLSKFIFAKYFLPNSNKIPSTFFETLNNFYLGYCTEELNYKNSMKLHKQEYTELHAYIKLDENSIFLPILPDWFFRPIIEQNKLGIELKGQQPKLEILFAHILEYMNKYAKYIEYFKEYSVPEIISLAVAVLVSDPVILENEGLCGNIGDICKYITSDVKLELKNRNKLQPIMLKRSIFIIQNIIPKLCESINEYSYNNPLMLGLLLLFTQNLNFIK